MYLNYDTESANYSNISSKFSKLESLKHKKLKFEVLNSKHEMMAKYNESLRKENELKKLNEKSDGRVRSILKQRIRYYEALKSGFENDDRNQKILGGLIRVTSTSTLHEHNKSILQ